MVPSSRPGYPTRAERISLDVPADYQNVFIILNRKAFEAGLVQMALSRSVVMGVITLIVRRRHPAKQLTHPAVFGWTQDQVPMTRHQHAGVEFDWILLQSFFMHSQERFVMSSCLGKLVCRRLPRFRAW